MEVGYQREVERVGCEVSPHCLALELMSERERDSGSSTAQQDQVCRTPQEPVSTPSTFWGSSLQDTSNLLPSAEPPAEMESIWGLCSSACQRVLYFEVAMSSESTSVRTRILKSTLLIKTKVSKSS